MSDKARESWPPRTLGSAALTGAAFRGETQVARAVELMRRINADPRDVAALHDLGTIHFLLGQTEAGLACRERALAREQVFRDHEPGEGKEPAVRLLAFAAPGDLMANLPLQLLVDGSDIRLDLLYVLPGEDLPERVPGHDMAFTAIAASADNREILERLAAVAPLWPCPPVLNSPERVLRLARDGVAALVAAGPGLRPLPIAVLTSEETAGLGGGGTSPISADFPLVAGPLGGEGEKGPFRLDSPASVAPYLAAFPAEAHRLSPFIDYVGVDGLYRKYRVVMIDGRPLPLHMALSESWIAGYRNADLLERPELAAAEAEAFADFDAGFGLRHAAAFAALARGVGLDYFAVDCAETADGDLLVFGADTAVVVHGFDPPETLPHKPPQMRRIRDAFRAMLLRVKDAGGT